MGEFYDEKIYGISDEYDIEDREIECNRCGAGDLHWEETDAGWRLFDEDGVMHNCSAARADDFEDLS